MGGGFSSGHSRVYPDVSCSWSSLYSLLTLEEIGTSSGRCPSLSVFPARHVIFSAYQRCPKCIRQSHCALTCSCALDEVCSGNPNNLCDLPSTVSYEDLRTKAGLFDNGHMLLYIITWRQTVGRVWPRLPKVQPSVRVSVGVSSFPFQLQLSQEKGEQQQNSLLPKI